MTALPKLAAEWEAFLALPRHRLRASVLQIIDRIYQDPQPFDFDRLMSAGIRLSRSSVPIAEMARALIDWVHTVPVEKRLGIAAALLNGLWKIPRQIPMIFEEDLLQYLNLVESIPITEEQDNVRQTLASVLQHVRSSTREKVSEIVLRLGRDL